MNLCKILDYDEKVLANHGYSGPKVVHGSLADDPYGHRAALYRAAHERLNGRLKMFACLQYRFRHVISKHHYFCFTVLNVVQLDLEVQR